MKSCILTLLLFPGALICQSSDEKENQLSPINMTVPTHEAAIEALLFSYRDALNASEVAQAASLYTEQGVFMPSHAPTAIGQAQLREAYAGVFASIQLTIEFFVDEIVIEGEYAFARTMSRGTTLIHATGETVAEENRELFVLQLQAGQWKIARYMFNKIR